LFAGKPFPGCFIAFTSAKISVQEKGEFIMKTLEKVSDFVGKYMAAIVIVVAALSLLFPGTFSVVKTAWVNTLLGIVMFGMGLTLKPEDFKVVFSRPKDVIIGCIAQFTLMPFLAWALTQLFRAGYRRHPCGYLPRRHLL
jgi:predicted Na+-dependent transporter